VDHPRPLGLLTIVRHLTGLGHGPTGSGHDPGMNTRVANRPAITIALALTLSVASCAKQTRPPAGASSSASSAPARVDLVEAGIRAVAGSSKSKVLFVQTRLCDGDPGTRDCTGSLTDDEIQSLSTRLRDLTNDVRFVSSYEEIPQGEAPIEAPNREFVSVGEPQERANETFWITAGETCGGLCGHGGTYVLEERDGAWVSTGTAPGTSTWIS
jgi:hypothetical protein